MPKRNPVAHPTALQAPPQSSADSQWSRAPKLAESSPSTSAPNIALATLLVASVPTRIEIRRENLPVLPPSGFDGLTGLRATGATACPNSEETLSAIESLLPAGSFKAGCDLVIILSE